jgi:alkylation response protein AidB-like acyl-CoA dehydrogenase
VSEEPEPGDAVTDEVAAWVHDNWDHDVTLRVWWARLADAGFAFPTWPEGFGGRRMSSGQARQVVRALADARVIGPPGGVGQTLGAPTVLAHGTDEQKAALVPPLVRGVEAWCQLFSEPGAGSDLASLRTSAVRDGDEWVITGQKVWNSSAHLSDRGLLLARTDRSVPKHEGISFFVIDMDQPGIEARPLRQMNGESEFCEVFISEARVPQERMIGGLGQGWTVAQTTLAFERAGVSSGGQRGTANAFPGSAAGMLDRTVGELADAATRSPRRTVSGFVISNGALATLATRYGRTTEPAARQGLAGFKSMTEVNRFNGLRARAAASRGERPGAETSIGKLAMSNIAKRSRDLAFTLMGAHGMLDGHDAPGDGDYHKVALASFGAGFGGGTDEIQRNVIGERALGLPREPQVDRGVPFEQIPSGAGTLSPQSRAPSATTRPESSSG